MKRLIHIGCGLLLGVYCAAAQEQTNHISQRAERVLRSACEFLAHTPAFSFNAETDREHVDETGEKIQYSHTLEMDVRRPNGLRLEISSPLSARGFWYNGKTLTVLDRKHNWYSVAPMPATIDKAADTARDQLGIDLPLIDLALSNPYENITAEVEDGQYFGLATVLGVPCHHLAFTQENVDWQVWIEDGPQPLVRKFVITEKNEPGAPEFTALITHWDMTDRIAGSTFVFEKPTDAAQIEMRGALPRHSGTNAPESSLQENK
jgi:hypothetical protein